MKNLDLETLLESIKDGDDDAMNEFCDEVKKSHSFIKKANDDLFELLRAITGHQILLQENQCTSNATRMIGFLMCAQSESKALLEKFEEFLQNMDQLP
jgi:hypothetical protein